MDLTPVPSGSDIRVNTVTSNGQRISSVATLDDGGFIVTWMSLDQDGSGWGIYGQRYDASGAPVGGEFRVNTVANGNQAASSVAALDDGGFGRPARQRSPPITEAQRPMSRLRRTARW
jgi:hypothetical protein